MRYLFILILCLPCFGQAVLRNAVLRNASISQPPPPSGFTYTATKFNAATPDFLSFSGNFTGVANSGLLTVSFWFKLNDAAQNSTDRAFMRNSSLNICGWEGVAQFVAANDFYFQSQDSSFANALRFATAATFTADSTWHHIMFSVDLSNVAKRSVYVDGTADVTDWVTYNNTTINWANGGDSGLPSSSTGTIATSVSLSEVYVAIGQYIDLTVAGNRALFRSGSGHPVSLGSDGSTPTGTAPTIYLKNPAATFQNNAGTGGNFTAHGSPSNDASIP